MRRENDQRGIYDLEVEVLHQLEDLKKAKRDAQNEVEKVLSQQATQSGDQQKKKQVDVLINQRVQIWRTHGLLKKTVKYAKQYYKKSEKFRDNFRKLKQQVRAKFPEFEFETDSDAGSLENIMEDTPEQAD